LPSCCGRGFQEAWPIRHWLARRLQVEPARLREASRCRRGALWITA